MSFQAYLDSIKAKTGKDPEDFHELAVKAGIIQPNMKATVLVDWLKKDFGLGHGHCMCLWNVFVSKGWVVTEHTKLGKKS